MGQQEELRSSSTCAAEFSRRFRGFEAAAARFLNFPLELQAIEEVQAR